MITITVKEEQLKEWIKSEMILRDGRDNGLIFPKDLFEDYDELADEIVKDFVEGH